MEPTAHARWLDLLPAHALGALDGDERRELEAHLAGGCASCAAELAALQRDLAQLGESVAEVPPPPRVRRDLLAAVEERAAPRPAPRRGWPLALAAGIAALLAAGALLWGVRQQGRLDGLLAERERLASALATAEQRLERLESERAELVRQLSVVGGRELHQVQLAGLEGAPTASGRALIDPGGHQALFSASGLPALAAGRTYQLWFISDGTPVSAGVFAAGPRGEARVVVDEVPALDRIQAWAVTVEPAGGVPQPTGPMVLRG